MRRRSPRRPTVPGVLVEPPVARPCVAIRVAVGGRCRSAGSVVERRCRAVVARGWTSEEAAGPGALAHGSSMRGGCNTGAMSRARSSPPDRRNAHARSLRRYGITVPFDGVPLTDHRTVVRGIAAARVHRRVVGRDRRRSTGSPRWPWLRPGRRPCSWAWPSSPPTPGVRPCWPRAWRPWPRRPPGGSPSGSGPPRT